MACLQFIHFFIPFVQRFCTCKKVCELSILISKYPHFFQIPVDPSHSNTIIATCTNNASHRRSMPIQSVLSILSFNLLGRTQNVPQIMWKTILLPPVLWILERKCRMKTMNVSNSSELMNSFLSHHLIYDSTMPQSEQQLSLRVPSLKLNKSMKINSS